MSVIRSGVGVCAQCETLVLFHNVSLTLNEHKCSSC